MSEKSLSEVPVLRGAGCYNNTYLTDVTKKIDASVKHVSYEYNLNSYYCCPEVKIKVERKTGPNLVRVIRRDWGISPENLDCFDENLLVELTKEVVLSGLPYMDRKVRELHGK